MLWNILCIEMMNVSLIFLNCVNVAHCKLKVVVLVGMLHWWRRCCCVSSTASWSLFTCGCAHFSSWSPVIPWSSLDNTLNHMTASHDMCGSSLLTVLWNERFSLFPPFVPLNSQQRFSSSLMQTSSIVHWLLSKLWPTIKPGEKKINYSISAAIVHCIDNEID